MSGGGGGIGVLSYMDFQVSSGLCEKPTTGYSITILDIYIQVFPIRYDKYHWNSEIAHR